MDPQAFPPDVLVVLAAGTLMLLSGLGKRTLEWLPPGRRQRRRRPADRLRSAAQARRRRRAGGV